MTCPALPNLTSPFPYLRYTEPNRRVGFIGPEHGDLWRYVCVYHPCGASGCFDSANGRGLLRLNASDRLLKHNSTPFAGMMGVTAGFHKRSSQHLRRRREGESSGVGADC